MTRSGRVTLAALVAASLGGCAATDADSMQVNWIQAPSANFSGWRTFDWMKSRGSGGGSISGDSQVDQFVQPRVRKAVESQLAAKGFSKAASGKPDFLIGYGVALHGLLAEDLNEAQGYRGESINPGQRFDRGSLILDVVDPAQLKLVWRGYAQARLNADDTEEMRSARLTEAVRRILAQFPPS